MAEDPNLYPGTSTLRNRRGIRDPEKLERFETDASNSRLVQLQERSIAGDFDRVHLQSIHRHIFQDVYEWAGGLRSVDLAKPGSPFFARPPFIAAALDRIGAEVRGESQLRDLVVDAFAMRAGHYLGEINAVHPFREGNGRAQREFIRQLAENAGHHIDWSNTPGELMYQASALSFQAGDSSGLAALIRNAIAIEPESQLSVYVPGANELIDRREDFKMDVDQTMRVLGQSGDGKRIFGRCGAGVLSVAREVFTELPHVDDTLTLSRIDGRDVAHPQEHDRGVER